MPKSPNNKILCLILSLLSYALQAQNNTTIDYAILISANAEWRIVRKVYTDENYQKSPWGEYFYKEVEVKGKKRKLLFFHGGWGKIAAAGSSQYLIDQWKPQILINLGTCGGFEGEINRFDVVLVDKTVVYDIIEQMGDSKEAIADYTTDIDLSWLGDKYPSKVIKSVLVSADKDLMLTEIEKLKKEYKAKAGDWESGAIAYVAARNKTKILILRGVSDTVSSQKGEAYGNFQLFQERTESVMRQLFVDLGLWLELIETK